MYMINLIIIYDVVNIFSMKNYESLRKLRVGVNRYTGVNWSTTTTPQTCPLHSVEEMTTIYNNKSIQRNLSSV